MRSVTWNLPAARFCLSRPGELSHGAKTRNLSPDESESIRTEVSAVGAREENKTKTKTGLRSCSCSWIGGADGCSSSRHTCWSHYMMSWWYNFPPVPARVRGSDVTGPRLEPRRRWLSNAECSVCVVWCGAHGCLATAASFRTVRIAMRVATGLRSHARSRLRLPLWLGALCWWAQNCGLLFLKKKKDP